MFISTCCLFADSHEHLYLGVLFFRPSLTVLLFVSTPLMLAKSRLQSPLVWSQWINVNGNKPLRNLWGQNSSGNSQIYRLSVTVFGNARGRFEHGRHWKHMKLFTRWLVWAIQWASKRPNCRMVEGEFRRRLQNESVRECCRMFYMEGLFLAAEEPLFFFPETGMYSFCQLALDWSGTYVA